MVLSSAKRNWCLSGLPASSSTISTKPLSKRDASRTAPDAGVGDGGAGVGDGGAEGERGGACGAPAATNPAPFTAAKQRGRV